MSERKTSQQKLIEKAEQFAGGCSRSRLELRLVDEIHRLNRIIEELRRGDDA
jgi:hypothetical protein